MPRWIWKPCVHWPCHGREVRDEHPPPSLARVSGHAPQSWIQAAPGGSEATGLCCFHGAAARLVHYGTVGPYLGQASGGRASSHLGATSELCADIRPLSARHGPAHTDSAERATAVSPQTSATVPVFGA